MRDIQFRGKRIDNGEWVYGGYAKLGDGVCIMPGGNVLTGPNVIPETVGQLVKNDSYGKPFLFEGDICKFYTNKSSNTNSNQKDKETTENLVLIYIKEWTMFAWLLTYEYQEYLAKGISALDEVLFWTYNAGTSDPYVLCGNIYDNPELLE